MAPAGRAVGEDGAAASVAAEAPPFDARHNLARCPRGKILRPKGKLQRGAFQHFHARAQDCRACPLRERCVSPSRRARVVVFNINHPSLLRARRKRLRWGKREGGLYQRHRWQVEGAHGEAKTWHGLARAVRRGLDTMRIQAFLIAAAINLKRLAAALRAASWPSISNHRGDRTVERPCAP
jgi:Transposase DDE domain